MRCYTGVASFNETNIQFDVMDTSFQIKLFCACCPWAFINKRGLSALSLACPALQMKFIRQSPAKPL